MKHIGSLVILFVFVQSCAFHREMSIFNSLKRKRVEHNRLKINGYYFQEFTETGFGFTDEKRIRPLLLYNDGVLFVEPQFGSIEIGEGGEFRLPENSFEIAHKNYFKHLQKKIDLTYYVLPYEDWGIYRIQNDSIRILYYLRGFNPMFYDLIEKNGIIINDTTFQITEEIDYFNDKTRNVNEVYKFRKLDAKPDSICWINEE